MTFLNIHFYLLLLQATPLIHMTTESSPIYFPLHVFVLTLHNGHFFLEIYPPFYVPHSYITYYTCPSLSANTYK